MSILYERQASGSVDEVGQRFEDAVKAHKFGVLGMFDLKQKMREKGVEFERDCRIYEICNPQQAKRVLERNMSVSAALPCRVSVFQDGDAVKLSTILPTRMLGMFDTPDLQGVAEEVEQAIKAMIDEAAGPGAQG